jgi:hypothetical protein
LAYTPVQEVRKFASLAMGMVRNGLARRRSRLSDATVEAEANGSVPNIARSPRAVDSLLEFLLSKSASDPKFPGDVSGSCIFRRNAFRVDGKAEALGLLIIQDGVFVPIIRCARQKNE